MARQKVNVEFCLLVHVLCDTVISRWHRISFKARGRRYIGLRHIVEARSPNEGNIYSGERPPTYSDFLFPSLSCRKT